MGWEEFCVLGVAKRVQGRLLQRTQGSSLIQIPKLSSLLLQATSEGKERVQNLPDPNTKTLSALPLTVYVSWNVSPEGFLSVR